MSDFIVKSKPKLEFFDKAITLGQALSEYGQDMQAALDNYIKLMAYFGIESITLEFQSKKAKQEYLEELEKRKKLAELKAKL